MRCGCPECGAYMIQSESMTLGCVCPECMHRCTACLGTNTVMSRDMLKALKEAQTRQLEREKRDADEYSD